eukprot:945889-Prymnesium_polylepis.2
MRGHGPGGHGAAHGPHYKAHSVAATTGALLRASADHTVTTHVVRDQTSRECISLECLLGTRTRARR